MKRCYKLGVDDRILYVNEVHCYCIQTRKACVNHSTGKVYRAFDEKEKSQLTPCRTIRLPAKRKALEAHQADPVHCATRHRTHPPILQHTPRPPTLSFLVVPAQCLPLHRVWIRIMVRATRGGSARRPQPDRRRERGSNNQSLPPQEVTGASDSPSDHCHKLPTHLLLRLC